MRQAWTLAIVGLVVGVASACGGTSGDSDSSPSPTPTESTGSASVTPSTTPSPEPSAETIIARAQVARQDLRTFHISQSSIQELAGLTIEISVEMDIEVPDRSYSVFESPATGSFEMVAEGTDLLVRFPGDRWRTAGDALGDAAAAFDVDPPDFAAELDVLSLSQSLQRLDDGEIDGEATYRVRGVLEATSYYRAFAELMGAQGLTAEAMDTATGEVIVEYDIRQSDYQIVRGEVTQDVVLLGIPQEAVGTTILSAFNEPVDIPRISDIAEPDPPGTAGTLVDLDVGDCFSLPNDAALTVQLTLLDCEDRHLAEVYYLIEYADGAFPGDEVLAEHAVDQCFEEFEQYVGVAYEESEIFADLLTPTAEMWDQGHRSSACILYLGPERLLLGSLAGSNR